VRVLLYAARVTRQAPVVPTPLPLLLLPAFLRYGPFSFSARIGDISFLTLELHPSPLPRPPSQLIFLIILSTLDGASFVVFA